MSAWHWIDYTIIIIISLSVITGLFRGFVKELIALGVWISAIWLAVTYSQTVAVWLEPYIADKTLRAAGAFIGILVVTIIVGGLINTLFSLILRHSGLSGTDRVLGMGFGFIRGIFIVALLMLVMKMTGMPYQDYSNNSRLYTKFDPLVDWLYGYSPAFMKHMSILDKNFEAPSLRPV